MSNKLLQITIFIFSMLESFIVLAHDIPKTSFLKNYTKRDYNASTQNWDIVQDENNIMYFANNLGVLQYDGINWELIEMPNKSVVRSLLCLNGDSIMAGAYSEFGIIYPNKFGELVYDSWINKIPLEYRSFAEIWRIYKVNNRIIIQSFSHVFIFENEVFLKAIISDFSFKYSLNIRIKNGSEIPFLPCFPVG